MIDNGMEALTKPIEQDSDLAKLERLVVNNADVEELEKQLDQFNVFEALGAVRQEVRHSCFLAFLMDPTQNHGLGDQFARRFLQKVLISAHQQALPVTPIDLDIWDLNDLVVQREWQNIDILLLDPAHRLAVIIENKIDSTEHSHQLQRYLETMRRERPGWNILGIYLTPDGDKPKDSDSEYLAADYSIICETIEQLLKTRSSSLGGDVRALMTHYAEMIRRHIVSESKIAELCRQIYRNHKSAFDLILEHRPDQQAKTRELLEQTMFRD